MLRKLKTHLNPATVLAAAALFVALGGVSYAAVKIDGKDIKNKSIAGKKLKNGAVTNAKVKKATLKADRLTPGARAALKGNTGPQGPAGPQGPQGEAGTALAYAQVNDGPSPSYVADRTSGFVAIDRPANGHYCLTPSAEVIAEAFVSGNPGRPVVASVEYGNTLTPTDNLAVLPRGANISCPENTFEVRTFRNGAAANDVAFTVIVP